jgi:hypothetical protein
MSDNYTPAEIDTAVDEQWEALSDGYGPKTLTIRGEDVPVERLDGVPGREGGGEDIWVVIKVGDQLFRKDGYYGSGYGEDWDGGEPTEVRPVEKTVTVYESVS